MSGGNSCKGIKIKEKYSRQWNNFQLKSWGPKGLKLIYLLNGRSYRYTQSLISEQ